MVLSQVPLCVQPGGRLISTGKFPRGFFKDAVVVHLAFFRMIRRDAWAFVAEGLQQIWVLRTVIEPAGGHPTTTRLTS